TAPKFHPDSLARPENKPSLRQRLAGLRYIVKLVPLVWETNRAYTVAMVAFRLAQSLVPVSTLWIGKLIVHGVVRALSQAPDYPRLWRLIALEMGIGVANEVLGRASGFVDQTLGELFSYRMSIRIMEHAATLDLHKFEDPQFYDHLERAGRGPS